MKKWEEVRFLLLKYHLTQSWLLCELEKAGVEVDKSSLCEMLNGRRRKSKAETVIECSLEILHRYGKLYANG